MSLSNTRELQPFYKLILISIICSFLFSLIVIYIFSGISFVPSPRYPPFADLSGITCAVDCMKTSEDAYIVTRFNPFERTFNYPHIGLKIFGYLKFGSARNAPIWLGMIYIFILATVLIFKPNSFKKALFIACLILSPLIFYSWIRLWSNEFLFQ